MTDSLRRLLLATTNQDKLREIRHLLADLPVELVALAGLPPVPEPEETGATFQENARLKALYYARSTGLPTVAEDSGLEVDALDGEPGVRSARFLGPSASYPERFTEIYRRLAERTAGPATARFVCALALVSDGQVIFETTGVIEGTIASSPQGTGGFGYDPIFYYPPYGCTLAQVSLDEKARVDHRGQAFQALAAWLRRREIA